MPNFTIRWANRSHTVQQWEIHNGDSFLLNSNYVRAVNVTINANYAYDIQVNTNKGALARADLIYDAVANTWHLNSDNPHTWELASGNGLVTVRCYLEDYVQIEKPTYQVNSGFSSSGIDPFNVQSILEQLKAKAASILGSALGSKPLEPFIVGALGNFPYYWQNPNNLEFNAKTYTWISSALKAVSLPKQLLAVRDVTDQQVALLNAWKNTYEHFPSGDGQAIDRITSTICNHWADSPTTLTKIQHALNLNELLNTTPASGKPIIPVLANYLNALGSSASDNLALVTSNITPKQLDQSFNSIYIDAFGKVAYSLSSADQAKLNQAHQDATNQQVALLNAWKNAYGSFPPGDGQPIDRIVSTIATKWADPATTLTQIQTSTNINQLLNKTPASGKPIIPVLANYLNALGSAISLENNSTLNQAYLGRALANVQNPTANNGGLQTDDGVFRPAYQIATQLADIINGLKGKGNAISLKMSVSRYSESEFSVSISGGTAFNVPIFDLFTLSVDAQARYFSDHIATSSNTTEIELTYTGVTLVNYGPVAYDLSIPDNYWYWTKPITDAIKNGDSDVSGFKFSPKPQIDFSESGPFGYVTGVAISNYPSVKITVTSSDYKSIETTFEQKVTVGLSFLGIPLRIQGSESTYSHNVSVNSSSQTVTITLDPPQELIAGNAVDSVGWVLGVQTEYPGA